MNPSLKGGNIRYMDGDKAEQDKSAAIVDFTSGMKTGILKMGEVMQDDARIGLGTSEPLPQPISDSFGTFRERKVYQTGCDIGEIVKEDGRALWIITEDENDVRNYEIGKTPQQYDPRRGGRLMAEAGTPNDYLLISKTTNKITNQSTQVGRYLDGREIMGVVGKKGEQISLKPSPKGDRQIVLQGIVNSISTLR